MLSVTLLTVGKLKESYLREACAEYAKRLSAFCRFQIIETEEFKLPDHPSAAQIQAGLASEGKRLLAKLPPAAHLTALCIEGRQQSSEELADAISSLAVSGTSQIALVIGGSYGLSEEVKARAVQRLSMSKMTFPHQLARVMLCEQLYRAFSIQANTKYHK